MYYGKLRVILSAVLVTMASAAMAQQQCFEYTVSWGNKEGKSNSREAACAQLAGATTPSPNGFLTATGGVVEDNVCAISYTSSWGSAYDGKGFSGFAEREIDCPDPCPVGTPDKVNVTVGYSRTPGAADGKMAVVVSRPWEGGTVCYNGCKYSYGTPIAAWWHDQPTSSGLYRGSMDMNVTSIGGACNGAEDEAISQAQPDGPNCPGSVGQVNGKPYCAGTAQNPVANDQDTKSPYPSNTGNPPTGNIGEGGTGSGRTPQQGSGGPAGGPGGTGSVLTPGGGGSGSGTVNKPPDGTEQANCGAPGQPKCAIDETGTPRDGSSLLNGANGQVDESREGLLDLVNEAKELKSPEWTWTFQLPSGCTNMTLTYFGQEVEIDVCRWQPTIHDLMSMLWIATTIAGCIILVNRTMSQ